MPNLVFLGYKQVLMQDTAITGFSVPNLLTSDIRSWLIDIDAGTGGEELAPNTDQDLADLLSTARVSSALLTGKSIIKTGNTCAFAAGVTTFISVTGDTAERIAVGHDTGSESTSLWLAYYDTFTSGMPVNPNGGNITVTWAATGLFAF